jgi:cobyrinic acid a,c-diamide synthase
MVTLPRVVIAAPASGHGKTSVTTGLLAALRDRGLVVSPHKVGPDYIDPGYHALAAGRPGRNLDPWLVGPELIEPLFLHGALTPAPADIAVVEGVMGLFDGVADRPGFSSTAHVASLLRAPVILVVDVTATGRSVAALVHGFSTFDPAVRVVGVIANRVGSDRHRTIVSDALAEVGVPMLGAIGRSEALATPSRHLGLIPVAERAALARNTVAALGQVVAQSVDLDAVVRLARAAPALTGPAWTPPSSGSNGPRPVIAVAGGPAFSFSYTETEELLTAAGAAVARFDPLRDETLPRATSGLVIGGGFPEVHAEALSDNLTLREDVREHCARSLPVAAECAGLLYLSQSLDGRPMCGVLDIEARMAPRLTLGYREAVAATGSVLGVAGTRVRGHEFHRSVTDPVAGAQPAWQWRADGIVVSEGHVAPRLHASYLHLHWASLPRVAERFVAGAQRAQAAAP